MSRISHHGPLFLVGDLIVLLAIPQQLLTIPSSLCDLKERLNRAFHSFDLHGLERYLCLRPHTPQLWGGNVGRRPRVEYNFTFCHSPDGEIGLQYDWHFSRPPTTKFWWKRVPGGAGRQIDHQCLRQPDARVNERYFLRDLYPRWSSRKISCGF